MLNVLAFYYSTPLFSVINYTFLLVFYFTQVYSLAMGIESNKNEQLRLFGSKLNSEHKHLRPKVVELPRHYAENQGHDDFIDSTRKQIEFHAREAEAEGMPLEQAQMHREQLELHRRALLDYPYLAGIAEVIPIKTTPDDLVA